MKNLIGKQNKFVYSLVYQKIKFKLLHATSKSFVEFIRSNGPKKSPNSFDFYGKFSHF